MTDRQKEKLEWEETGAILYSVDDRLKVTNNTTDADQLSSIMSMMLHHTASTIESYMDKYEPERELTYEKVMDLIIQIANMYKMAESGMDADTIKEVLGIDIDIAIKERKVEED